jgi:hypothetical protein
MVWWAVPLTAAQFNDRALGKASDHLHNIPSSFCPCVGGNQLLLQPNARVWVDFKNASPTLDSSNGARATVSP